MVAICYFRGNKACLCGKVPITLHWWQMLCLILQIYLLLPCHHISLDQGHWLGYCPLQPSVRKHGSAAPAHAPAQSQGPGLSQERRGYEHMNHSLEKEKFQAIKQGGKLKAFTFLCLLCLNFSLKTWHCFSRFYFSFAGYQELSSHKPGEWHTFLKLCSIYRGFTCPLLLSYGLIRHSLSGRLHLPLISSSSCHPEAHDDTTSHPSGWLLMGRRVTLRAGHQPMGERKAPNEPRRARALGTRLPAWWHLFSLIIESQEPSWGQEVLGRNSPNTPQHHCQQALTSPQSIRAESEKLPLPDKRGLSRNVAKQDKRWFLLAFRREVLYYNVSCNSQVFSKFPMLFMCHAQCFFSLSFNIELDKNAQELTMKYLS